MKATYVSVWDNGSRKFKSSCNINLKTKKVTELELIEVEDAELLNLDEEYIELPGGEFIKTFTTQDRNVVNGQLEDFLI